MNGAEPSTFRPAADVLGDAGRELFAWFVDSLVKRSGAAESHSREVAQSARLEFAIGVISEVLVGFDGATYEVEWDGTVGDARRIVLELLPSLVGQVKADRGRLGGRHPWDD